MQYAAILVGVCLLYILVGVELMPWIRKFQGYWKEVGQDIDKMKHCPYPVSQPSFLDELWANILLKK